MNFKAKYLGLRVNCQVQDLNDQQQDDQIKSSIQKASNGDSNPKVTVNFDK